MDAVVVNHLTKRYPLHRWLESPGTAYDRQWLVSLIKMLVYREEKFITALDDVSLRVREGEVFGVLGPNGSGKTTLIKCIVGVLRYDDGEVAVYGHDPSREPNRVKRMVSLIGAGSWAPFDWSLTVYENMKFYALMFMLDRSRMEEKIGEALRLVGLWKHRDRYPETLSSGMRQRMLLACGLMLDKPLYLMDEPTVGIDPYSAMKIRESILSLAKNQGKTVILTTHNLMEAESLCDRVAILREGRIAAIVDRLSISSAPGWSRVRITVHHKDGELLSSMFKEFQGSLDAEGWLRPGRLKIVVRAGSSKETIKEALRILRRYRVTPSSIDVEPPSLEDIYLKTLGGENA